ncbi:hypothetical protein KC19_4G029500 [Ceratodon purpureus]|uniref:Uncharacterized protein n=1 Tax=Ceratodon purpureus TaxID=3225 RepID=A0A8T0I745_CERPU|nr:hypothetical protein KC19_4G029500 [Ceratodon purpureus]
MSITVARLQELRHAADEEKAAEIRSVLVSQGMEHLLAGG